jgi:predicted DNA-binding transcriptional regulator AlpA
MASHYTLEQLAEMFDMPTDMVLGMVDGGLLPKPVKLDGLDRWKASEADRYLEAISDSAEPLNKITDDQLYRLIESGKGEYSLRFIEGKGWKCLINLKDGEAMYAVDGGMRYHPWVGFNVTPTETAYEAMAIARDCLIDGLGDVFDRPDLVGFELCKEIRKVLNGQ